MNPKAAWRSPAVVLLGLAAIATGVVNIVWGDFDPAEEPIQAFGNHISGRVPFAYAVAVLLILGGAAILSRRSARVGAPTLAVIYGIFAIFWLPRFYWVTVMYGPSPAEIIGVAGGVCQEIIIVAVAVIIYTVSHGVVPRERFTLGMRLLFGLCAIVFGLVQLVNVHATAVLVPTWIPFGGDFWAVATGVFFVLGGIGITRGLLDVLAARLLALMLFVFSVLALAPQIFAHPHDHAAWGVNVYNLAAVGAMWVFAEWLALLTPKSKVASTV